MIAILDGQFWFLLTARLGRCLFSDSTTTYKDLERPVVWFEPEKLARKRDRGITQDSVPVCSGVSPNYVPVSESGRLQFGREIGLQAGSGESERGGGRGSKPCPWRGVEP